MIPLAAATILLPFAAAFAGMLLGPRLSRLLSRTAPEGAGASSEGAASEGAASEGAASEGAASEGAASEGAASEGAAPGGGTAPARGGPALIACLPMAAAMVLAAIVAFRVWQDPGLREGTLTLVPTGTVRIAVGLQVDGLAAVVGLLVCCVALAVQVYSVAYMRGDPRYSSYAAFISLFTAAMLLVVCAADLLLLYVGWEVMGVCSYFLIGHHWEDRANSRAAVKAFLVTRIGDVGFLFGIFVLGLGAGTFRIQEILQRVPEMPDGTVLAGTLLLLAGVAGKSAQFPLHTWLPDAMAGPTPISALIHAATMVAAGIFVVARLYPAFLAAPDALTVLGIMAAISMLGSALAALAQDDIKRVLAYSTISQLAYMAAGLAVGTRDGAIFHLLTHGAFKALLFLAAGCIIFVAGSNMLRDYGGMRSAIPVTFWSMTIGFAALVGLPPVSGFFSKDAIIERAQHTAIDGGEIAGGAAWIVYLALLVTVAVTAAYATRAWLMTFFGEARARAGARGGASEDSADAAALAGAASGAVHGGAHGEAPGAVHAGAPGAVPGAVHGGAPGAVHGAAHGGAHGGGGRPPWLMSGTVLVLAVPSAVLGFFGLGAAELQPQLGVAVISSLLAAAGIAAVFVIWNRDPALDPARALGRLRPVFDRAFYMDELYAAAVVRPVRALARLVVRVDDGIVDRAVEDAAPAARRLGGLLRLPVNGNAQTYLTGVLAGVFVIAAGVVIFG